MSIESDAPNAHQNLERIVEWISGTVPVPALYVIVVGKREEGPTDFARFACLYPDPPPYRGIAAPTGGQLLRVRQEIDEIQLPDDADDSHQRWMRQHLPGAEPEVAWGIAERGARASRLPIGFYAAGQTADGERRAMVWMNAWVSPRAFTKRLQEAARGPAPNDD